MRGYGCPGADAVSTVFYTYLNGGFANSARMLHYVSKVVVGTASSTSPGTQGRRSMAHFFVGVTTHGFG